MISSVSIHCFEERSIGCKAPELGPIRGSGVKTKDRRRSDPRQYEECGPPWRDQGDLPSSGVIPEHLSIASFDALQRLMVPMARAVERLDITDDLACSALSLADSLAEVEILLA